jgi:hypothetical protein
MVLGCPRGDRSTWQVTFSLERRPKQSHTAPVSARGKERTMLNAALGMLAMVPVVFAVAGYVMVARRPRTRPARSPNQLANSAQWFNLTDDR